MLVFRTPLARVHAWSVASQQRARRNAMVQLNALAAVRAQREEVQEFLAAALIPPPAERRAAERA